MMKNGWKEVLALGLSLVITAAVLTGCGGDKNTESVPDAVTEAEKETEQADAQTEPEEAAQSEDVFAKSYKIGIVNQDLNALALERKTYLEEYVGPAFNVEFMFSEAIDNADSEIAFIDNAITSGAQAIISYRSSDFVRMANYCNDKGIWYCSYDVDDETKVLPYSVGGFLGDPEAITGAFKEFVEQFTSDGEAHGFLITSGGASRGNTEQMDITIACLQAISESYGLTYSDTVENISLVTEPTEVENSANLDIMVYPGYPNDQMLNGMSAAFQTGKYDVFLTVLSFSNFAVAIDEVERSFDMDIKTGGTGQITEALVTAFATDDKFGNSSINAITFNSETARTGKMFAAVYNCLSGHSDILRQDGNAVTFAVPYMTAHNREEFDQLKNIDKGADTYVCTIDDIKNMLAVTNPDLTFESFNAYDYTD